MAKSPRNIPDNFPQPLGMQILKADAYRQASMLRQEVATDLLATLHRITDPVARLELVKVIDATLQAGRASAERAAELWPGDQEAEELVNGLELKDSQKGRFLKQFAQFASVHDKSQQLLAKSFDHIAVILERLKALGAPE